MKKIYIKTLDARELISYVIIFVEKSAGIIMPADLSAKTITKMFICIYFSPSNQLNAQSTYETFQHIFLPKKCAKKLHKYIEINKYIFARKYRHGKYKKLITLIYIYIYIYINNVIAVCRPHKLVQNKTFHYIRLTDLMGRWCLLYFILMLPKIFGLLSICIFLNIARNICIYIYELNIKYQKNNIIKYYLCFFLNIHRYIYIFLVFARNEKKNDSLNCSKNVLQKY